MIKFKDQDARPVQIIDACVLLLCLVGVFVLKPDLRNFPYNAFVLLALTCRVFFPILFKMKFRFYMSTRFLFTGITLGSGSFLFGQFSATHPILLFYVLSVTLSAELLTACCYLRKPSIKEQLDPLEPLVTITGKHNGVVVGLVDLSQYKESDKLIEKQTTWQVEFKEGLEQRILKEKGRSMPPKVIVKGFDPCLELKEEQADEPGSPASHKVTLGPLARKKSTRND